MYGRALLCLDLVLQESLRCLAYKQSKAGRVVEDVLPSLEQARGSLADLGRQQLRGFLHAPRVAFLADFVIRRCALQYSTVCTPLSRTFWYCQLAVCPGRWCLPRGLCHPQVCLLLPLWEGTRTSRLRVL